MRKNKNKKKWQPMEICMTLTPQQGMSGPAEIYAKIDLLVYCCDKYPVVPPRIQLENSRGLSNEQIAVLSNELKDLSQRLQGEVMIFDLAQHTQKFLHENNKPGFESFYEEMVSRQQEKMQTQMQEMQEKQLQEDKERQLLQDEIQKRREALQAALRESRDSIRQSSDANLPQPTSSPTNERQKLLSRRRNRSSSGFTDGKNCNHQGTKLLEFDNNWGERQVHRGRCLGHSSKGSNVYAGVDKITGELLAITEWSLKCGTTCSNEKINNGTPDLQHSLKQIGSIEQELNHLQRLQHPNLVRYYNLKNIQVDDKIIIYIVQEFVVGTTCSFLLTENFPVNPEILRHIATGVLSALEFLHNNNIVHKDLRDTSIHIDRQGFVKVSDYSLNKRLSDIYNSSCLAKVDHDFATIQGRGGKKLDIYRFGIILLSLLKGTIITDTDTTDLGHNIQPELRDFLSKCLNSNERSRWSAEKLQTHYFIRAPIEHGISPPKTNYDNDKDSSISDEPTYNIAMYQPSFGGQSRIQNEFEGLKWLGKGAYGDVIKARNKLDGGIYAIKRIRLDGNTKQLNKKITREVKLLSRLNHENVVRYFNSWIESGTTDDTDNDSSSVSNESEIEESVKKKNAENNAATKPRASALSTDSEDDSNDNSSDEDSDEDWDFLRRTANESSDFIEFEKDSQTISEDEEEETTDNIDDMENGKKNDVKKEIQFMYIQMEFCEKSTLRTAIDNCLYQDEERVWRLFREMVEGLAHIHQQGMIHRDLKPVNIFLDSYDHVKIGDFGLATTNIIPSLNTHLGVENDRDPQLIEKVVSFETEEQLNSMTGQVGTALYVAPELNSKTSKAMYNQKVDIYSLGIILFEMCYKPMETGMERIKILMNIRSKEIIIPDEINERDTPKTIQILRSLLNHDPSQRPTSPELLSSEFLPPPPLEEAELHEMIGHTVSNRQSRAYKYLINSCFNMGVTSADNVTYDMGSLQKNLTNEHSGDSSLRFIREYVKEKVIETFKAHGGVDHSTSLLMPKFGNLYNDTETCSTLMTRSGLIVSLPHDLRAPFARSIAWNNITQDRKYTIERVYREKKVHGFHPRELYECAFDIVSTKINLLAESELIYMAWEIFENLPELDERTFTVRINHTSLLQGVLMYCGIEAEKYKDIYTILCDARSGRVSKFQVQTHLISLCLTDQAMAMLFNLFEIESSASKIQSVLKSITKRKSEAAGLVKDGLCDIDIVIENVERFGVKLPIVVAPLLVPNTQYSGIFYQITCEPTKHRRRRGHDVIAAGGRYDKLVTTFRQVLEKTGLANPRDDVQHAVGISISLDRLVGAVGEVDNDSMDMKYGTDIAVCCCTNERERELTDVLKELWTLGLRITPLDFSTIQETHHHCRENSIAIIVLLQPGEKGSFRLHYWERDRYQDRKYPITDIIEKIQEQLSSLKKTVNKVNVNYDNCLPANVNIRFVPLSAVKLSVGSRKSYKHAMLAQMTQHLDNISPKKRVNVFAVSLDNNGIKTIVYYLEIDGGKQDFDKSIQLILEK